MYSLVGPKVISKDITISSIDEVSTVLCRPPVIWDNLHANDYDQRRLFLGPYDGRSTALIPKLNGVLTNPNCEYGANYVAIHTLAQWSKCGPTTDKALEVVNFYNPKDALNCALIEWMGLFQSNKRKTEDYLPSKTNSSTCKANEMEQSLDYRNDPRDDRSDMLFEEEIKGRTSSSASSSDMDTTPSHENSFDHLATDIKNMPFNIQDLKVLVDYFYLPHVHGEKGQLILKEFSWLKQNAPGRKALTSPSRNNNSIDNISVNSKEDSCDVPPLEGKLHDEESDGVSSDESLNEQVCNNDQVNNNIIIFCVLIMMTLFYRSYYGQIEQLIFIHCVKMSMNVLHILQPFLIDLYCMIYINICQMQEKPQCY